MSEEWSGTLSDRDGRRRWIRLCCRHPGRAVVVIHVSGEDRVRACERVCFSRRFVLSVLCWAGPLVSFRREGRTEEFFLEAG